MILPLRFMKGRKKGILMQYLKLIFLFALCIGSAHAAINENEADGKGTSGLPIPRFASLRVGEVNMRTGPGTRYPIEWVLTRPGLPVEITAEYDIWRRVRDPEGAEGWVHKNALSGKRMAIVTGSMHDARDSADVQSAITAHVEAGTLGKIMSCTHDQCRIKFDGTKAWLRKSEFWGVKTEEVFD
jgi:SH3-like domain-containing protein